MQYSRLIRYASREWRFFIVILALTTAISAVVALEPWPLKILMDIALGGEPAPAWLRSSLGSVSLDPSPLALLLVAAGATLALFVLNSALDAALALSWTAAGQRMVHALAADLFARLQRFALTFHRRRRTGDLLARLTDDTWCVHTVADALLVAPLQHVFMLAAVTVAAWSLDRQLTAIALGVAAPLAAFSIVFGHRLRHRARRSREAMASLMSFIHQTLTSVPVVQAFSAESRNRTHFEHLSDDVVDASQHQVLLQSVFGLLSGVTTTLGTAIILFLGGLRVLGGSLSLGSLLVFLAYIRTMQFAFERLMSLWGSLKSVDASVERVTEVLDAPEDVVEGRSARSLPGPRANGHVVLEAVTFGYEPGRPVVHGVSVEVLPGETVALVGRTGAGKSSLAALVPRFFDPWKGRVLLDGQDVRELRLREVRQQVGLVLQDAYVLPLSVADNIAYGHPDADWAAIARAARAANVDDFVRRLPAGYNTVLGERGETLSGGEQQRLAIARALLKDAPVLILDEPTAALDAETEALVLEALERLMAGRTTFIIAHRLSTVRRADRILVLEAGEVVEDGTHRALVKAGGLYATFYQAQLGPKAREIVA